MPFGNATISVPGTPWVATLKIAANSPFFASRHAWALSVGATWVPPRFMPWQAKHVPLPWKIARPASTIAGVILLVSGSCRAGTVPAGAAAPAEPAAVARTAARTVKSAAPIRRRRSTPFLCSPATSVGNPEIHVQRVVVFRVSTANVEVVRRRAAVELLIGNILHAEPHVQPRIRGPLEGLALARRTAGCAPGHGRAAVQHVVGSA